MTTPEQSSSAGPGDEAGAISGDAPHDSPDPSIDDLDFPPLAGRPRVIRAELARSHGWKSAVEIVLERDGRQAHVRRDAIGEEVVLLRCAAESTIEALHELLGGPPRFALVGAKRVLAFDSAVILACVRTLGGTPRKLIGCVPITEDPVLAVTRAILHATNRIVEALPNAPPAGGGASEQDLGSSGRPSALDDAGGAEDDGEGREPYEDDDEAKPRSGTDPDDSDEG